MTSNPGTFLESAAALPEMSVDTPPKPPDIRFLDGLRGLAAVFVLIHHASFLLIRGSLVQLQSFGHVTPARLHPTFYRWLNLTLDPFRYGHVAVVFFFVLSGFVIHLRYAREMRNNPLGARFGWPGFVWRRVRRLYPPLLLAIGLTSLLYAIGSHLSPTLYRGMSLYSWDNGAAVADTRWTTLLANLTFLMPFYAPWWSGNSPLWSLGYEWWFYMLYPAFWWITKQSLWASTGLMAGLFVLSLFPSAWPSSLACKVLGLMPTWWLGVLLAEVYIGRIRLSFAWLSPLMLLMAAFQIRSLPDQVKTLVLGLGFAGVLAFCFTLRGRGYRLRLLSQLKPLGDMSYTLYVTHIPILILLSSLLIFRSPRSTLPDAPWVLLTGVATAISFAWLAHWVVEAPFTRPRRREPRADPPRASAAAA
jgi:peptidoglycan/LPS O-acetylase OafA/YrhL